MRLVGTLALALALCVSSGAQKPPTATKKALIVFGDSLSDNGNFFATIGNHTTPLAAAIIGNDTKPTKLYWKGRSTNYPGNWNDLIIKQIERLVVSNFAYGGATLCSTNYTNDTVLNSIPDVQEQVRMYLHKLKTDIKYKKSLKDRLRIAVMLAGPNDIQFVLEDAPFTAAGLPAVMAQSVKNATKLLLDSGHKVVAVGSVPPLDLVPFVVELGPQIQAVFKALVTGCNLAIRAVVTELQAKYTNRRILYWDVNTGLAEGFANYKALGFKHNNTEACLTTGPHYNVFRGSIPLAVCSKPNEYIFWDGEHPTSASHGALAASMVKLLIDNGVISKDDLRPVKPKLF